MASGEGCVFGAGRPLGIAAEVPGRDGSPGVASAGFPRSFAVLVCSCGAAGWGEGLAGPGGSRGSSPGRRDPAKVPARLHGQGDAGGVPGRADAVSRRGEDATSPLCVRDPGWVLGGRARRSWGRGTQGDTGLAVSQELGERWGAAGTASASAEGLASAQGD